MTCERGSPFSPCGDAGCASCGGTAFLPLERNASGAYVVEALPFGARMVLVPGASFRMGSEQGARDERPVHAVTLGPFLLDETPVTWRKFMDYVEATGAEAPPRPGAWDVDPDQPVVNVTWEEAVEFCEWRRCRLPTEAERELAARGPRGATFPWGSEAPGVRQAAFDRPWSAGPPTVGSHVPGASPFGVHDLAGPVLEWTADWYAAGYGDASPRVDPSGPAQGRLRVARGASFTTTDPAALRGSARTGLASARHPHVGFRCARSWQGPLPGAAGP